MPLLRALRAENAVVPALELERLRNRQVLFFLDTVGQYVDSQPELRGLPLEHDLAEIAAEFGIEPDGRGRRRARRVDGRNVGPPAGPDLSRCSVTIGY